MGRPIDPFAGGLRLVLLVFGILLVAGFCTPMATKPSMVFHWEGISDLPIKQLMIPILWIACGVLGAIFGAIPLASIPRGALAAALGLLAIVYPVLAMQEHDFHWQLPVIAIGGVLAPAGLLIRDSYRGESLGRVLTTIGAVCILATYLVPDHGAFPLTDMFIKHITDGEGTAAKIHAVFDFAPFALAILSLAAWLPGTSGAGAKLFAWLWILLSILGHYSFVIATGHIGDAVKASPFDFFFGADGVVPAAYVGFAAYGLATLLGKNLERR